MDVRIGIPNEHLTGSGRNEINQPMYATSVGLIMKGFDYLDTYKKSFSAGTKDEYVRPRPAPVPQPEEETEEVYTSQVPAGDEGKTPLTEKIKMMLSKMFEIEDQKIS